MKTTCVPLRSGAAAILLLTPPAVHAAEKTWDGQGVFERWASGINWVGNNAPVTGDALVFPANGSLGYETDNDFPSGTTFSGLEITNQFQFGSLPVEGWIHRGNSIGLTGGLHIYGAGAGIPECRIEFPISLVAGSGSSHGFRCDVKTIFTGAISMGTRNLALYASGESFLHEMVVQGPVSGSGKLTLGGIGRLKAANNLTGVVEVSGFHGGKWTVENAGGLGTAQEGTILESSGELFWLPGTCAESFYMDVGYAASELHFEAPGGVNYTGVIEVKGSTGSDDVIVNHPQLHVRGQSVFTQPFECDQVEHAGIFEIFGEAGGSLTLRGNASAVPAHRQVADTVSFYDGTLILDAAGGQAITAAGFKVGGNGFSPGETVRWLRPQQVPATCALTADRDSHIDLNGQAQTLASLKLREGRVTTGAGTLTVSGPITHEPYDFNIQEFDGSTMQGNLIMTGASPGWHVDSNNTAAGLHLQMNVLTGPGGPVVARKTGIGPLYFTGLASGLTRIDINRGTLDYSGSATHLDIRLQPASGLPSAFVGRSCQVRDIGVDAFTGPSAVEFEDGVSTCRNIILTPAVEFRRNVTLPRINEFLAASGTVDLGGAKLVLETSFTDGLIGAEYMLIRKDSAGPATGHFVNAATGLPVTEGQTFAPGAGDWIYRFSYAGGDGNDFSLKLVSFVPEGITRTWLGSGGNSLWDNDNNWDLGIAPGFTCVFPGVTNRAPVYNYPAGTILEKVIVTADGYSFLGNAAGLLSGVQANYATGLTTFGCPVILAGSQSFKAFQSAHLRCGTNSNGTTNLNSWTLTLDAAAAGATVEIGAAAAGADPAAAITGKGSVIKRGPGDVILYAPSNFSGLTQVVQGKLKLGRSPLALGASDLSSATVVNVGTMLELAFPGGNFPEVVAMNGGTLRSAPGAAATITAQGVVQTTGGIVEVAGGQLHLSGGLTGNSFTKRGPGVLQVNAGGAFTLSNLLNVEAGTCILARAAGSNVVVPCTVTNAGSVLQLAAADQLDAPVTLGAGTTFDLNGHNETLPAILLTSAAVTTGAGTLTCPEIYTTGLTTSTIAGKVTIPGGGTVLDVLNDDPADDVTISAVISGAALTKTGDGAARLPGNNTFTSAQINDGALVFTGTNAAAITLNGGMIGGNGTVGTITSTGGGLVSPGTSTGIFNSGSIAWNAATTFAVELNGSTPGTGHDQLNVTGAVNLGGAAIQMLPGSGATGVMVIVNNDGTDAVTGTFAELPENTLIAAGSKSFRISYLGGTGNDVTLTLIVTGTGVAKTWSGLGANNQWTLAANWSGGVAPVAGDDLVFPSSAGQKTNFNNFAAGTVFNSLRIESGGYSITGSGLGLNAGIVFDYASALSTLSLDVTLANAQSITVLQGAQASVAPSTGLATAGFALTAHVDAAAGRLTLVNVAGGGSLVKTGPGGLTLNANTFTGAVTLSGGETKTTLLTAFGTGASAIAVNSGAELRFENIASGTFTRPLTLSGKLEISASPVTLSGAISLPAGGLRVVEVTGATPALSGVLSGSGGLRKTGTGTLTLSGAAANTFSGGCTVADGTLRLAKSSNFVALPGPVTIGDGADTDILLYAAANQIGNAAAVSLTGSGAQLQCATFSDTIGSLRLTGGRVTGSGTLTVAAISSLTAATTATVDVNLNPGTVSHTLFVDDGAASPDLIINGEWNGDAALAIDRTGPGTLVLAGNGIAGTLTLGEGLTRIERDWSGVAIALSGGSLGGTGPVGDVATVPGKGGFILPGARTDILAVSTFTGDADTVLTMELGGLTPGTGHDVLNVRSIADPQDATLNLIVLQGFTLMAGQTFTIITNDDSNQMVSEFRGLEEGGTFPFAGATARISYNGGDGNDVVITILSINDTGSVRVWDGGGADNDWLTAANWDDDTAPVQGDSLTFPPGGLQPVTTNNFPAGTNFQRIALTGGYTLNGNGVLLDAGVRRDPGGSGNSLVQLPVSLTGPQTIANHDSTGVLLFTGNGSVSNGGHTLTTETLAGCDIQFGAPLSGPGSLLVTGPGDTIFVGTPAMSGTVSVLETAHLQLGNGATLGSVSSISIVGSAELFIPGTTPATITQPVFLSGRIQTSNANHILSGTVTLPAGAMASMHTATASLAVIGRIQGAGGLLKSGTGTLKIQGPLANTFTGGFQLSLGSVELAKPAGLTALPGPVTNQLSAPNNITGTILWAAPHQIADTASISRVAHIDLAGFDETIASAILRGSTVSSGAGTLTLTDGLTCESELSGANPATATISGNLTFTGAGTHLLEVADGAASTQVQCSAVVTAPAGAVVRKTGAGSATFTGACLMSDFQIAAGEVNWNGNAPATFITMAGGTLAGTGTANQIISAAEGGLVTPGASPGTLHASNINWNAATTFRVEVNGPAASTEYNVMTIEDESSLGGATLDLQFGYTPAIGDAFTLIDSAGTGVLDTFAGLPEGAFFVHDGNSFRITYTGGSGGDVVVTRLAPPAPEIVSFTRTPGTGPNAGSDVVDIELQGYAGQNYVLEISDDLVTWTTDLTEPADAGGQVLFHFLERQSLLRRFYRARLE